MAKSKQPKKRLVVDLTPAEHKELAWEAKESGMNISNYIRKALNMKLLAPCERTDLTYRATTYRPPA